jgi:REP element-mobilizing transposase RayT
MVFAYHVIVSCYGFWLPNDQRGSWSDFVRCYELLRFGAATKVDTRRSVAGQPFDRSWRDAARAALRYPAVRLTPDQVAAVAAGIADGVRRSGYVILACAIEPDHVHLVIARHEYPIEQVVNRLKGAATRELAAAGVHPLGGCRTPRGVVPSPWAEGMWVVYLDSAADIERAIPYVEHNPVKAGRPRQVWPFVTSYADWCSV